MARKLIQPAIKDVVAVSDNKLENEQKSKSKTIPLWIRIVIPVVIVCLVFGIYFYKNYVEDSESIDLESADFDLHVTGTLDLEKLKSYNLPIMIDFGADSCIPCKEMAPVLEKLNDELKGEIIIKFVDVWKYKEISEDYPIRVIPTQVFIDKDGKPFVPSDPQTMQMNLYAAQETNEHVFTTHEGGMTEEMILDVLREMGLEQ